MPNAQTQIIVTATDATGSTSTPASRTVRQDGQPPAVSNVTPGDGADAVSANQVSVVFTEAVIPASLQFVVSHQVVELPGTVAWSEDARTLTYTPAAPLPPNAIVTVLAFGATDSAGNVGGAATSCFVTAGGVAAAEPQDDVWFGGSPGASLVPVDVTAVRVAVTPSTINGLVRFTSPRSLNFTSPQNVFALIDLDVDRDGDTGFPSLKDLVFEGLLPLGMRGSDFGVVILPQENALDSSYVVQWADTLQGSTTFGFFPGLCSVALGFSVPRAALPGLGSEFGAVLYTESSDADGFFADPAPDAAAYVIAVPPGAPQVAPAARGALGRSMQVPRRVPAPGVMLRW